MHRVAIDAKRPLAEDAHASRQPPALGAAGTLSARGGANMGLDAVALATEMARRGAG